MSQPPKNPEGQPLPQDPRQPPPGWYLDPAGQQVLRWWDGTQWGPHTQPLPAAGQASQRPDPDADGEPVSLPSQGSAGPSPASVPPVQPYGQGSQPPPPGPQHGQGPRKPWTNRRKAGVGAGIAAGALVALIIAIGVGASNSPGSSAAGSPSSAPGSSSAAAGSPSAAAGSPSAAAGTPSSAPCTSHGCIVQELDQSLTGGIDQADAVATKVHCYESTVKNQGNGNWTASCTVTYSDGSTAEGTGTVDTSQGKVAFEPEGD